MTAESRPPYGAALGVGAGVFVLYVLTLAPTTAWWDTSEYIATAYSLGIPHPPGNPFFVALARTWTLLLAPLGLSPAVRVNLFAAATSAASFVFLFLIIHRSIARAFRPGREAVFGACVAVLPGATAYTVWSQSTANEKVYTLSVLVVMAVSWLVLRWKDRSDHPRRQRLVVAAVYLMALGTTSHLMSVLPALALGLFVLMEEWRILTDPRFVARCVAAVAVGLSFNFFLPIRAAQRPVINEGDSVCAGLGEAAVAIYTNGRTGCEALAASLRREQYSKPPVTMRMAPFAHQFHNYFQYFDWQWGRGLDPDEPVSSRRLPLTLAFLALGLVGFATMWRGDRSACVYFAVLVGTLSLALVFYLNFKYGYSLAPEITDPRAHEVRERDYFFLASFAVWGGIAGLGIVTLWLWIGERLGSTTRSSPVLVVAVVPLLLNLNWADRSGDYAARDWAYDLLNSVEPYALLFTNGDNDTFPLWYAQEVEGVRQDVTVIVVQYLFTEWYPRQLRELTGPDRQRAYVRVEGSPFETRAPPTRPAVGLQDDQLARIGDGPVPDSFKVPIGNVMVEYPAGMYLGSGHRIALHMISNSVGDRPIYFAGTGGEMAAIGLGPWGVREGLAARLVMRDLGGPQPEGYHQGPSELGGDWFDFPRSQLLVDRVYSYRGIESRNIWQDASTLNIPVQYYVLHAGLSAIADRRGDSAVADRYAERARGFLVVAQGGADARRSR